MKKYYADNREKRLKYTNERRWEQRKLIIEAYGGKCVCCGETEFKFLSLDHIHGGGTKERREGISGFTQYLNIIRNGFPKDKYQILCYNCNMAKGFYGKCPHQK